MAILGLNLTASLVSIAHRGGLTVGCMLRNLARKLGLIRPCGTLEISYPDDDGARPITFGGPSFHITERGVEGPFYPVWWEDRLPCPDPSDRGDTVSIPPDEQITLGGE